MALASVNLAEASGSLMARETLAEVYATAAVTALVTCTEHIHFIAVSVAVFSIGVREIGRFYLIFLGGIIRGTVTYHGRFTLWICLHSLTSGKEIHQECYSLS